MKFYLDVKKENTKKKHNDIDTVSTTLSTTNKIFCRISVLELKKIENVNEKKSFSKCGPAHAVKSHCHFECKVTFPKMSLYPRPKYIFFDQKKKDVDKKLLSN